MGQVAHTAVSACHFGTNVPFVRLIGPHFIACNPSQLSPNLDPKLCLRLLRVWCARAAPACRRLGYEVEATTVALAFGIHEAQPSQKEVFAFLPVRRYGLNFIVQVHP